MSSTRQTVEEFLAAGGKIEKIKAEPKPAWAVQKMGPFGTVYNTKKKKAKAKPAKK